MEINNLLHSPEGNNPAHGLLILARIIARVHMARLAGNIKAEPDNSYIDDWRNQQTDHEDIP